VSLRRVVRLGTWLVLGVYTSGAASAGTPAYVGVEGWSATETESNPSAFGPWLSPYNKGETGGEERLLVPVNVWGEVKKPGYYEVPDGTDAVEVVSYAGGPTEYANLSRVHLTRTGAGVTVVDIRGYLGSGDMDAVPMLKPGDTVYVTRNTKYAWRSFIEVVSQLAVIAGTIILYTRVAESK